MMQQPGRIVYALQQNIGKAIVGKDEAIEYALIALLCKGHVLIEDVPGVGKTTLAREIELRIGEKIILLSHDSYYRRHDELTLEERNITFADTAADEIKNELKKLDINTLTPIEAMNLLFELQRKARG